LLTHQTNFSGLSADPHATQPAFGDGLICDLLVFHHSDRSCQIGLLC
jgi:hypothetical protein